MSTALQVALFLASIAIVVFVSALIPVFVALRRHIAQATHQLEELKSDVKLLVRDSHVLVQNVNGLATRAHQQLDEVDKLVRTVGGWSDRADRIVQEVGNAVETPIFMATRIVGIIRNLGGLLETFAKKTHPAEAKNVETPGI